MTEVSAKLSRFKSSASKIRLLADQIRGKKVDEALDILIFSPKSGSRNLKKLLESAISSAENNYGLDIDTLYISHISVDEALIMKRIRARARGRADRIEKKSCHINLKLSN